MACCHDSSRSSAARSETLNSPRWRRALWIALGVNAAFFLAEIIAGAAAGSVALQADALDFFGDAANYAISLGVAGMALTWRARAAIAKGTTLILFALWVLGSTAWHAFHGTLPRAEVMGVVGIAALIANGGVALMLYRFRGGDANMRSVWICSMVFTPRRKARRNRMLRSNRFRVSKLIWWLTNPRSKAQCISTGARTVRCGSSRCAITRAASTANPPA